MIGHVQEAKEASNRRHAAEQKVKELEAATDLLKKDLDHERSCASADKACLLTQVDDLNLQVSSLLLKALVP